VREIWRIGGLGRENARIRERESEQEEGGEKKGEELRRMGVCERVSEWVKVKPREGRRETERAEKRRGRAGVGDVCMHVCVSVRVSLFTHITALQMPVHAFKLTAV